jgi:energy-coupling factor transport system ATP-binding protein
VSIKVENLTHIYDEGMPFENKSLDDVSFEVEDGDFVGLIGHTGSGKSTLIQHLNGLIKQSSGKIYINDFEITQKGLNLTDVRKRVGVVFQYPEYQLFEETIAKDVAFGPENLGLPKEKIDALVKDSIESVGLDFEEYKDKSPFELSGGQKRRVAIAGVIAMEPEVLILDEPTAGLDPAGRDEIFELIKDLHRTKKITIILSSHNMDDMAKLANTILVMNRGRLEFIGSPREIFKSHIGRLKEIGLDIPQVLELAIKLREKGLDIRGDIITVEEAKDEIIKALRGRGKC